MNRCAKEYSSQSINTSTPQSQSSSSLNLKNSKEISCACARLPSAPIKSLNSSRGGRRTERLCPMGGNLSKALSVLQKKGDSEGPETAPAPLEDPPTPPATDPRLPLTARQLFNITKSWKGIARAMEPTGITMFVRLFEENEDILHMFQKFQHKRFHEFHRDSMELAQHASIVMNTLDESIKKLNNVDYFMDYLHAIGKLHTKIPGFQRDYFWRIESPFLAAVQDTLGDRYTDNMENIYKITIRYILDTIVKGFDLNSMNSQPPKASPDPSPSPPNIQGDKTTINNIKNQVSLKS